MALAPVESPLVRGAGVLPAPAALRRLSPKALGVYSLRVLGGMFA